MSGPRRPSPNQLERVPALSENIANQERTLQSITETVDFAAFPAALPSKKDENERVPPLPQMPAAVGTTPTLWDDQSSAPASLLPSDSLVYRHPIQKPLLDVDLRRLATVSVAIAAALAMVVTVSILGLRLGADQAGTTSRSSGFFDSGNSDNAQGSPPTWVKGNAGVLDGDEMGRGSSDISSNQFSDGSTNRLGTRSQRRPLPPTTSPILGPVDPESTDASIGSNTNSELAHSGAGDEIDQANADGSVGGLSAIEPGSAVAAAFYANCTEARAAGAAPIPKGSTGYRPALDADDDGVACETSALAKSPVDRTKLPSSTTVDDLVPTPTVSGTVTVRTPIERTTTSKGTASTKQNPTTTVKPTTTRRTTTSRKTTTARATTTIRVSTTVRTTTTQRRTTATVNVTTTTKPTTATSATTTSSQTVTSPPTSSGSPSSSSLTSTTSPTASSTTTEGSNNDLVELGNRATSGNQGRALGQSRDVETND